MKVGVDLGGSHIGIGLVNENGNVILKKQKDLTEVDRLNIKLSIERNIISIINKLLEEANLIKSDIELIGIAAPGAVNDKKIIKAENLNLFDFNIVKIIKNYFGIPVKLNNDAKCAAIAEKTYGGLKQYNDAVFLCLGTGIGGAVFLNNIMLKPEKNAGFEVGHMIIEKQGKKCKCGKYGCFEKYASMQVLKENIKKTLDLQELSGIELEKLLEDEKYSIKIDPIIKEFICNLSIGLGNLIDIFEPEVISLGGSFAYYERSLLNRLIQQISNPEMTFNKVCPKIICATLKNDAGIIGSVC